jgi:GT2 family glycosyltransferase
MALVDVVVVSYNSREQLRGCVESLTAVHDVNVVVVDNDSADGSLDAVSDLDVVAVQRPDNAGFARGCNAGWRAGEAPYVLFLNPDARIDETSVRRLVQALERTPRAGAVAPRLIEADGSLEFSLRRFPRLGSTFSQALFVHKLLPRTDWADDVVHDVERYEHPGSAEWVPGACVLVRREMLEMLDGWDEGFFLYCEDKDLCRRIWDAGYKVRFEPGAVAIHVGGASAPRTGLLPVLAGSRIRYARKHRGAWFAALERTGIALAAAIRVVISSGGRAARIGHARALRVAISPSTGRADGLMAAPEPMADNSESGDWAVK